MKYKCKKGEKQHKVCKEYDMDICSDCPHGAKENSIEEDIKIVDNFVTYFNRNIQNGYKADLTVLGEEIEAIEHILSDYKRVLKENERYKKSDYETICLENNELREITDRIQSEYKDLLKDNFKLKNELETKRKEYQETYEDIREELGELKKENEELNNRCRNLDKEAQAYLEELAGDNTLIRRTIKQLQEENEECKLDVQDYLKQAQENAEMYRKAQKKIQDLKAENEELKNNTRKNENELEFDIDCDWIALQKMLDESEKSNEYISYKNEKWIKEKYCIPVQKIKDKIEELNSRIEKYREYVEQGIETDIEWVDNVADRETVKVLQELLEGKNKQ